MVITILTFIIILGLLIFVHELGHFIVAKKTGVGVEEFGFGFPPRLLGFQKFRGQELKKIAEKEKIELELTDYKLTDGTEIIKETVSDKRQEVDELIPIKKWRFFKGNQKPKVKENLKGGTIYSINFLPLGGFVKIKGEQGDKKEDKDSFANKKIWQRSLILGSGVFMNYLLAAILLSIGFFIGFPTVITADFSANRIRDEKIQTVSILEGSPAEKAGFQIGDTIRAINGQKFKTIEELQQYNQSRANEKVVVTVERANKLLEKELTLAVLDESKGGKMGTGLVKTGIISYPWYRAFWEGIKASIYLTWQILVAFYELIKNLIITQKVSADLAGPVGIAVLTSQVAHLGFIYVLQFTALLSINLAIINIIPFPALDGGRILFLFLEKIRGKAINQRIESLIHNIGFVILIGLVILVTFRDVARFKENIIGFLKNVIG